MAARMILAGTLGIYQHGIWRLVSEWKLQDWDFGGDEALKDFGEDQSQNDKGDESESSGGLEKKLYCLLLFTGNQKLNWFKYEEITHDGGR